MKRVILSGRSGSGKTVALRALEDQGFYCVDNIPLSLIPQLVDTVEVQHQDLALGVDENETCVHDPLLGDLRQRCQRCEIC